MSGQVKCPQDDITVVLGVGGRLGGSRKCRGVGGCGSQACSSHGEEGPGGASDPLRPTPICQFFSLPVPPICPFPPPWGAASFTQNCFPQRSVEINNTVMPD